MEKCTICGEQATWKAKDEYPGVKVLTPFLCDEHLEQVSLINNPCFEEIKEGEVAHGTCINPERCKESI